MNIFRCLRGKHQSFPVHPFRSTWGKNLEGERVMAEPPNKYSSDPTETHSTTPALWNDASLLTALGEMASSCLNYNHPDNKQQNKNSLFLAITAQPPSSKQTPPSTVCYGEVLSLSTNTWKFAKCCKQPYKLCPSYSVNAAFRSTAKFLLGIERGINLVTPTLLPSE